MRILRKPAMNAAIVTLISIFYAAVFIITSKHIEFDRLLNHSSTLRIDFWNMWSDFLKHGRLKYIGYLYVLLAVAIIVFSLFKRRDFDEYQGHMLEIGLITCSIVMIALFPIAFLLILSDSNYSIESITFLVVVHWLVILVADLIYVIKWSRS